MVRRAQRRMKRARPQSQRGHARHVAEHAHKVPVVVELQWPSVATAVAVPAGMAEGAGAVRSCKKVSLRLGRHAVAPAMRAEGTDRLSAAA